MASLERALNNIASTFGDLRRRQTELQLLQKKLESQNALERMRQRYQSKRAQKERIFERGQTRKEITSEEDIAKQNRILQKEIARMRQEPKKPFEGHPGLPNVSKSRDDWTKAEKQAYDALSTDLQIKFNKGHYDARKQQQILNRLDNEPGSRIITAGDIVEGSNKEKEITVPEYEGIKEDLEFNEYGNLIGTQENRLVSFAEQEEKNPQGLTESEVESIIKKIANQTDNININEPQSVAETKSLIKLINTLIKDWEFQEPGKDYSYTKFTNEAMKKALSGEKRPPNFSSWGQTSYGRGFGMGTDVEKATNIPRRIPLRIKKSLYNIQRILQNKRSAALRNNPNSQQNLSR